MKKRSHIIGNIAKVVAVGSYAATPWIVCRVWEWHMSGLSGWIPTYAQAFFAMALIQLTLHTARTEEQKAAIVEQAWGLVLAPFWVLLGAWVAHVW